MHRTTSESTLSHIAAPRCDVTQHPSAPTASEDTKSMPAIGLLIVEQQVIMSVSDLVVSPESDSRELAVYELCLLLKCSRHNLYLGVFGGAELLAENCVQDIGKAVAADHKPVLEQWREVIYELI